MYSKKNFFNKILNLILKWFSLQNDLNSRSTYYSVDLVLGGLHGLH